MLAFVTHPAALSKLLLSDSATLLSVLFKILYLGLPYISLLLCSGPFPVRGMGGYWKATSKPPVPPMSPGAHTLLPCSVRSPRLFLQTCCPVLCHSQCCQLLVSFCFLSERSQLSLGELVSRNRLCHLLCEGPLHPDCWRCPRAWCSATGREGQGGEQVSSRGSVAEQQLTRTVTAVCRHTVRAAREFSFSPVALLHPLL